MKEQINEGKQEILQYTPLQPQSQNKNHIVTNTTFQSDSFISLTENQIFSHSIIKNVMTSHQNKSIYHKIFQINPNTVLNAQPHNKIKQQFNFASIPPKDKLYQSLFSSKIRQISEKYGSKKVFNPNKSQIIKITEQKYLQNKKNKVSVSGLVSYNFKSINASRSLGHNKINHEQKLQKNRKDLQRNAECKLSQNKKILQNFSKKRYERLMENQQLILNKSCKKTQNYLKQLIQQKQENQLIYNEKAKKINYIKQIMSQANHNYQDAQLIVNKIQKANQKEDKRQKKRTIRTEIDEEYEIIHRKIPRKKKKVMIRYVTFVD